jgi:hypothetical protein
LAFDTIAVKRFSDRFGSLFRKQLVGLAFAAIIRVTDDVNANRFVPEEVGRK